MITLTRLDSPLLPLLVTAVVTILFLFGILRLNDFNVSSLVTAGDRFCDSALVPRNLIVRKNSDGFDGQFYYRLALDPFTSQRTDFGITLDVPALRHQRILYPLLARILSLGDKNLVPLIMILINFSALCLLGWIGGSYAQIFKQHALWGIFLPLYPASLLTLSRDLVELVEVSLLLSSFLLLRRNKHVSATLLLVLAVLAKETAILGAVAALMVYVIDYEFLAIGIIVLIGSKSKIRLPVFGCSMMFWLFLFIRLLRHGD